MKSAKREKTEKCCVLQTQLGGASIGSQKGRPKAGSTQMLQPLAALRLSAAINQGRVL